MLHNESGFLLINKHPNITSSDLVLSIKKQLRLKKIGHTGTLDRFAEGLLILPFGSYTIFSDLFLDNSKTYQVWIQIGIKTDSGDLDGEILEKWENSKITEFINSNKEMILTSIESIIDWKKQIPPKISALKISGERQSDLFRKGIEFESKERDINIYDLKKIELNNYELFFEITVSKGTYIRKIALDLSEKLNLPLCVSRLVRTKIGEISILESYRYEQILKNNFQIYSIEDLLDLEAILIEPDKEELIKYGRKIKLEVFPKTNFLIKNQTGNILAYCKPNEMESYSYIKIFLKNN